MINIYFVTVFNQRDINVVVVSGSRMSLTACQISVNVSCCFHKNFNYFKRLLLKNITSISKYLTVKAINKTLTGM